MMKIPESFRRIMEKNHISEKQLIRMVEEAKEIAKKDLEEND